MQPSRGVSHLPFRPSVEFTGPIWEDRATSARSGRFAGIVLAGAIVINLLAGALPPPTAEPASGSGAFAASSEAAPAPQDLAPPDVRAIYLTSWSAATPSRLRRALDLVATTELNGVVIDIKDYTGTVAFATGSALIRHYQADDARLGDLATLVQMMHEQGLYVAVRIAAFQDQHLVRVRPELAVRDAAGGIWRDRKGLGWVDPASPEVWAYLAEIGRAAARAGVDELNFDYIRFPSDGNLRDLRYPVFDASTQTRRQVIRRFFEYLSGQLRPTGVVLSADLFGLATVKEDDLGIGQVIEDALLYFDYVSPMVYPSHYARGFLQYANPAAHPYAVVHHSLRRAAERRTQFASLLANVPAGSVHRPLPGPRLARIRPWLQAFDLGAPYPPPVIREQVRAVYDAGLSSGWYMWSASNQYDAAVFDRDELRRPLKTSGPRR